MRSTTTPLCVYAGVPDLGASSPPSSWQEAGASFVGDDPDADDETVSAREPSMLNATLPAGTRPPGPVWA